MNGQDTIALARPSAFGFIGTLLLLASLGVIMTALHMPLWQAMRSDFRSIEITPPVQVLDTEVIGAPASPAFLAEAEMSSRQLMARWDPLIADASRHFGVPEAWIRVVMRQESGGRTMLAPNLPITSSTGAMGVMQVMPATYHQMAHKVGLGQDAYDPRDNVYAGTAYLKWLYKRYGYPAMFAAYNDGPGKLDDHLHHGRPLPAETRAYIRNISHALGKSGLTKVALTKPNGKRVSIDAVKVSAVKAAEPGIYAPGVATVISIGKMRQGVRENATQVAALLRAHGAPV